MLYSRSVVDGHYHIYNWYDGKGRDFFTTTDNYLAGRNFQTININELAQGLRTEYLPGDKLRVKVIGPGTNPRQAVAYLPDGTMVVIDDAEQYIATRETVEIEFVRYLQTNAGKMMFAKLTKTTKEQKKNHPQGRKKSQGKKTNNNKIKH